MEADLLFKQVTVVDGTGAPGQVADVAVAGGRVAAVGNLAGVAAGRVIEGAGRVLGPGFVDMHGHSDYALLVLPGADSKIKQGITTEVGGNCGYSAGPVLGAEARERKTFYSEVYGLDLDLETFAQYLERLEAARPAINFAPQVGFNTVRASVMAQAAGPADAAALEKMRTLLRESFAAGAWGMSLGLGYAPGFFADTDEIILCAKEAAAVGAIVSSHMRSESARLVEAIAESLEIAKRAGVTFQVSHLKTSGPSNWGKLDRVFELVEAARSEGMRIYADRYPYIASFTQLSAALPDWVFEGGKEALMARMDDPAARSRIREEFARADPRGERWGRIVVAQVFAPEYERYEGRTVAENAAEMGMAPLDFICWLTVAAKDRTSAIYRTMSEDNLRRIYEKDWVVIGSDATARTHTGPLAEGKPHPRAYGTMPRVLAWAVKEKGWLELPAAIRKMTLAPCEILGLVDRGAIKAGLAADLVLFDPERVRDLATYDHPQQYPEGIEMVVVNGKVAVENGELTGKRAGQVLRRTK